MSVAGRDAAKRVPKSLGTDAKLFGNYTLTDVAVILFPGVIVLLATQLELPPALAVVERALETISLPAAGIAIALGALFVFLTPSYTSSTAWLATLLRFGRAPKRLPHELARGVSHVERVHPTDGAIERTDGALVGMIQVDPPAMALATDEDWAATADAFEDVLNTVVEFPLQLYSTTQRFPVEAYLEHFRARLDDADVRANPRLGALIEHFVEWYASELDTREMTIREHYVVVPVAPTEVRFDPGGIAGRLAAVPVLGALVRGWLAPGGDVLHVAMVEALDERLRRVEAGLREIEGCSARRLDAGEAVRLLAEFWNGEAREYGDLARVLRTRPVVATEVR